MKGFGKELGESLTLGFELVLPTVLGALVGYYLDCRLGSFPIAMAIGLFVGAAAGILNVARKFLTEPADREKRE